MVHMVVAGMHRLEVVGILGHRRILEGAAQVERTHVRHLAGTHQQERDMHCIRAGRTHWGSSRNLVAVRSHWEHENLAFRREKDHILGEHRML